MSVKVEFFIGWVTIGFIAGCLSGWVIWLATCLAWPGRFHMWDVVLLTGGAYAGVILHILAAVVLWCGIEKRKDRHDETGP